MKNNIIFEKKTDRLKFFTSIINFLICKLLDKISENHLKKQKQMIVFSFDHISHRINVDGMYEKEELEVLFAWLQSLPCPVFDGVALDIGANIGNHGIYFSRYYNEVYCFEPNIRTFKVLQLNAELVHNIKCFNIGLSNNNKSAFMNVHGSNIGSASLTNIESAHSFNVELRTLDSIVCDNLNIRLMKIDLEGHEYEVLLGSESIITRCKPIILFESNIKDFSESGECKIISLLKGFGYNKFATIRKNPRASNSINPIIRYFYNFFLRLIFGQTTRISVEKIEPGAYYFIIAIPDWVDMPNQLQ